MTNRTDHMELQCKFYVDNIVDPIRTIRDTNMEIRYMFLKGKTKRSINFIGNIYHWAFGLMDAKDANRIYSELIRLKNNNNWTSNIIKEQIAVIKSNFNDLSKPLEAAIKDIHDIGLKLNKVVQKLEMVNGLISAKQISNGK